MAQTATPIIEGALGVHVLAGQKTGESIIVTLPTEKKPVRWFAVDAFHGRLPGGRKDHAVMSFLKKFGLKLADCEFVLLTHMHKDHYSGIKRLITAHKRTTFSTHSAYRQDVDAADFFTALVEGEECEERLTSPSDPAKYSSLSPQAHGIARLCLEHCDFLPLNRSNVAYRDVVGGAVCCVTVASPSSQILSGYFKSGQFILSMPSAKHWLRKIARKTECANSPSCLTT